MTNDVGKPPLTEIDVDWTTIDPSAVLRNDLARKAIAQALSDRVADEHAAVLTRVEEETDAYLRTRRGAPPDAPDQDLLRRLEGARVDFQLADLRAAKCDETLRRAARVLATRLEESTPPARERGLPQRPPCAHRWSQIEGTLTTLAGHVHVPVTGCRCVWCGLMQLEGSQ